MVNRTSYEKKMKPYMQQGGRKIGRTIYSYIEKTIKITTFVIKRSNFPT